jgi:hypothetical protein
VYQKLLREGSLAAFEVHDRFYEIGSSEGLRDTEEFLINSGDVDEPPTEAGSVSGP